MTYKYIMYAVSSSHKHALHIRLGSSSGSRAGAEGAEGAMSPLAL